MFVVKVLGFQVEVWLPEAQPQHCSRTAPGDTGTYVNLLVKPSTTDVQ